MLKIQDNALNLNDLSDFDLSLQDLIDFCNEHDLDDVYISFNGVDVSSIFTEYGAAGLYEFIDHFEAGNLDHEELSAYVVAIEVGYGNGLQGAIEFTNENLLKIGDLSEWNFKAEFAAETADQAIDDRCGDGADWVKDYFNYEKFEKDVWVDGYSYYQTYNKRYVFRDQ